MRTTKQPGNNIRKVILAFLLVSFLGFSGWYVYDTQHKAPVTASVGSQRTNNPPNVTLTNIFTGPSESFTFKYPANWTETTPSNQKQLFATQRLAAVFAPTVLKDESDLRINRGNFGVFGLFSTSVGYYSGTVTEAITKLEADNAASSITVRKQQKVRINGYSAHKTEAVLPVVNWTVDVYDIYNNGTVVTLQFVQSIPNADGQSQKSFSQYQNDYNAILQSIQIIGKPVPMPGMCPLNYSGPESCG